MHAQAASTNGPRPSHCAVQNGARAPAAGAAQLAQPRPRTQAPGGLLRPSSGQTAALCPEPGPGWGTLEFTSAELRADRDIALAAVAQVEVPSESLLPSSGPDARRRLRRAGRAAPAAPPHGVRSSWRAPARPRRRARSRRPNRSARRFASAELRPTATALAAVAQNGGGGCLLLPSSGLTAACAYSRCPEQRCLRMTSAELGADCDVGSQPFSVELRAGRDNLLAGGGPRQSQSSGQSRDNGGG